MYTPSYPDKYPPGSSCQYKLNAPKDYEIHAECSLQIPAGNTSCTDYFIVSLDGSEPADGSRAICGTGTLNRTSTFNKLLLAYASTKQSPGGRVYCKITLQRDQCDCGWSSKSRIVGGTSAHKYEYPSTVSIRRRATKEQVCGASIINHRYIATATHCFRHLESVEDFLIFAGYYENNGTSDFKTIYEAEEVITHPDFGNNDNDIALVKTKTSMEWSKYIGPICLPFNQQHNSFTYRLVQLVGWGTIQFGGELSKTLQTVTVYVLPESKCKPTELCTEASDGKDACQFDSGGPVILQGSLRQYLVGIIARGNGCGYDTAANTRITSYLEWIYKNSDGDFCYKPLEFKKTLI